MKKGGNQSVGEALPKNDKIELDKKGQALVDSAVQTLTTGKKDLSPTEVLTILSKRERKIVEMSEKLDGLKKLRKELDELRSWDIDGGKFPAEITIKGEGIFKTHNSYIIGACKDFLEITFEKRIEEFESDLATVEL